MPFIPDLAGLQLLLYDESGPIMLDARIRADRIKDRADANLQSHIYSGRLINSGRTEIVRAGAEPYVNVVFGNDDDLKYAAVLDQGDRQEGPHTITGNPWLAFFWNPPGEPYSKDPGPGFYRFRSVKHPGVEAVHFLSGAIEAD